MKSGRGSKKQCQMQSGNLCMTTHVASSHIRSTAAKKSRVVPARCMYACTHWFLHLAAAVQALSVQGHIFYGFFPGSLMNPPNSQKTVGPLHRDDFNRSCTLLLWLWPKSCGHAMNGAISGILGAGHGMAERDAAGCPSKSSPAPAHGYGSRLQNLYTVCRHLRAASTKPKSLQTSVSKRGARAESFLVSLLVL